MARTLHFPGAHIEWVHLVPRPDDEAGAAALVHARLMEILAVNPATHTLVQDGPNFQEVPK